jgi:hypothetical protein
MRLCPYNPEINYKPVQFSIDAIAKYEWAEQQERAEMRGGCFGQGQGEKLGGPSIFKMQYRVPPMAHEFTVTQYEMLSDIVRALLLLLDVQLFWNDAVKWWEITMPWGNTEIGQKVNAQFTGGSDDQWRYFLGQLKDHGVAPWLPERH